MADKLEMTEEDKKLADESVKENSQISEREKEEIAERERKEEFMRRDREKHEEMMSLTVPANARELGVEGINVNDLVIPQLKLVHGMTRDPYLRDGSRAELGKFYHTGLQRQWDKVVVAMLHLRKEVIEFDGEPDERWRFLGTLIEENWMPFVMIVRGTAINSWRQFVTNILTYKKPLWSKRLELESKDVKGSRGQEWYVSVPRITGESFKEDELKLLSTLAEKFQLRET